MSLCGTGCEYLNPNHNPSTTTRGSASDSDETLTSTSGMTSSDPTSPTTTGYDTTSGTLEGDLPIDPSQTTVEPETLTGSTSTTGTESSTDPTDTEGETMGEEACEPNDPPVDFAIHVFDEENNPIKLDCGDYWESDTEVEWSQGRIRLKYCDIECGGCEQSGSTVSVHYPQGADTMKLTPNTLANDRCTTMRIGFDQPSEGKCVASSISIRDRTEDESRHYLAVSGALTNPEPDLLKFNVGPPQFECDSCEAGCCLLTTSGPHTLRFEDAESQAATNYLSEGAFETFWFDGRTAAAKNIMATSHDSCDEYPQQFAWVVSTLPEL